EHVKARAVQVAVLLAIGARRVDLDVGLDRLHDIARLRADDVLAVERRPALPGQVAGRIDPRLLDESFVEVAVGALERAYEGALLRPALPLAFLVFGRRLIVSLSGRSIVEPRHPPLRCCCRNRYLAAADSRYFMPGQHRGSC